MDVRVWIKCVYNTCSLPFSSASAWFPPLSAFCFSSSSNNFSFSSREDRHIPPKHQTQRIYTLQKMEITLCGMCKTCRPLYLASKQQWQSSPPHWGSWRWQCWRCWWAQGREWSASPCARGQPQAESESWPRTPPQTARLVGSRCRDTSACFAWASSQHLKKNKSITIYLYCTCTIFEFQVHILARAEWAFNLFIVNDHPFCLC